MIYASKTHYLVTVLKLAAFTMLFTREKELNYLLRSVKVSYAHSARKVVDRTEWL